MNVKESVLRLPDPLVRLIGASPAVAPLLEEGMRLEDALRSSAWADRLLASADESLVSQLRALVRRFAGSPFEPEQAVAALSAVGFTGAESRVGLARLRREGVVFAVRKAWGDQLLYVPTDAVPLWQRRLLPIDAEAALASGRPLAAPADRGGRLPLSIELLLAWHALLNRPIAFTSKGALNRAAVAKLAQPMRLTPEELAPLSFAYPDAEHLPRHAAFALDVGLSVGALARTDEDIRLGEDGLRAWLAQSARQADARLHELLVQRYASADPQLHLAASAIAALPAERWLRAEALAPLASADKADAWLRVLESCGWAERGRADEAAVFRLTAAFPSGTGDAAGDEGPLYVQPDGEIIVTPEVGLAARWTLETAAERVAADTLFVYRLTRAACARAFDAGYGLPELTAFLEERSGDALPVQVAEALNDWYERLGRTRLVEATLLRVASPELAAKLRVDAELSDLGLEPIGDRDFVVDGAARKAIEARLGKLGYPLARPHAKRMAPQPEEAASAGNEPDGWIYRPHTLRHYEADRAMPDLEALFPGVLDIPSAWLREPKAYHASTREAIVRRAIDWQAAVLVREPGGAREFVPSGFERTGADWRVRGHWRDIAGGDEVEADEQALAEVMILLPEWEEAETD